jgi:hypothetical protein
VQGRVHVGSGRGYQVHIRRAHRGLDLGVRRMFRRAPSYHRIQAFSQAGRRLHGETDFETDFAHEIALFQSKTQLA